MRPRLLWVCRGLLVINIAYTTAAVVFERLPGWKMFSRVDRLDYALTDQARLPVRIGDFIPRGSYATHMTSVLAVARFVCQRFPERGPFELEDRVAKSRAVLQAPDCEVRSR